MISSNFLIGAGIGLLVLFVIILFVTSYIKAAPDEVIIISGFRQLRTIIGHAGFKIPFLERADVLSLKLIPIDVKTQNAVPTKDYINVTVDAVVNAKISDQPDDIKKAAQNFLNKDIGTIKGMIVDVLEGNMREIVGQMNLVDMVTDRKQVSEKVLENAIPDLKKLGVIVETFNIQNFSDDGKVIENLGVDKAVAIQKAASISRANAERDVKIAQAEAAKSANDAQVAANLEIAQKQNDLEVKKADLKRISDTKKAEADAAYEIQKQEQQKTINITAAAAEVAKQEKQIEIRERMVAVRQKELEAEIQKKAEAEKQAQIQKSDADLYKQQKEAEAALFTQKQQAEAIKAKAEADKQKAFAEAAATKAKGEAEADAVKAKGLAEAAALDQKAEAMKKYGDAARQEMQLKTIEKYFEQLPAIAGAIAKPMEKIGNITMYGQGNTAQLTGDITKTLTQVSNGLTDSLGLDLKTVLGSMFGARLAGVAGTPKTVEKAEAEVVAEAEAPKAEAPKAPAQESEQVFPGITNAQAESIAAQLLGDQQRRRRR
jgi:flotillin